MRVIHLISGLDQGGAEMVLARLCASTSPQIRHHVVSMRDAGVIGPRLTAVGIPVDCLGMPRGRITITGLRKLRRAVRAFKPQVIQTWMYHADLVGGLAGRWMGIPVIWGIRSSQSDLRASPFTTRLIVRGCSMLSRYIPAAIACCSYAAFIVHRELGYAMNRAMVIANGYDLSAFKPDSHQRESQRARLGLSIDDVVIGMVGRWHPVKDHANFLAALGMIKRQGAIFRAVLIGPGMDRDNAELQSLIRRHGVMEVVDCLGPTSEVPALMNLMDVHVLSSLSESFPNVLAEAMACGTPCVTTNVGDAAQIVGDHGWVVPLADSQALATAISAAVNERRFDKQAWHRRQSDGRKWIGEHFTLKHMVDRYYAVWDAAARGDRVALNALRPVSHPGLGG